MAGRARPRINSGHGLLRRGPSRASLLRAAPRAGHVCDRAHAVARERIWHDCACDRRRGPRRLMRRRDDHDRQRRAYAHFRHPLRCSPQRRLARRAARRPWRADAGRAFARRDRRLARSQESAVRGRSGRGERLARRAHVAQPKPARRGANRDLERRRRLGRARGGLCAARGRGRVLPGREVAPAPAGPQDAGRLRGGRRDRGCVRGAIDRRFLRLRAHHRRLFAGERDSRLRRDPCRLDHHPGDHRRALRHHFAACRPADVPRLLRADRARPRRSGGRRRRDAGRGA